MVELVARRGDPGGHIADEAAFAFPESADGVAVLVVPFRPAWREAADTVTAGTKVPRLGDQLDLRQDRVLENGVEKARMRIEVAVDLPGQRRVARSNRKPSTCISSTQ